MRKFIRIIGAVVLFVISGGLTVAKRIADWVGRSTFAEDAEALGPKAAKMFEWLADQPAMVFYGVPLLLAAVGLVLLFWPDKKGQGSQQPIEQTPQPGARQTERFYTNDPEAEALDKGAYNQLVAFCMDHMLPTCAAAVDFHEAIIRRLTPNEAIASLAIEGLRNDPKYTTRGFWENYHNLLSGLQGSPGPTIKFEGIIECIHQLEKEFYKNFCEQAIETAKSAGLDLRAVYSEWQGWLFKHEKMTKAYPALFRDIRFGKLHRLKPPRWGSYSG